jgi:hypothetical protein
MGKIQELDLFDTIYDPLNTGIQLRYKQAKFQCVD